MLILGMDTATAWGTIALLKDGILIGEMALNTGKGGGESLLSILPLLLEKTGHGSGDIDIIAVGTGPGSYTGIRVGLAAVKGLAEGLEKPVLAINTLRIIAENGAYASGEWVAVALDARRGEVYTALYHHQNNSYTLDETRPPTVVPAVDLARSLSGLGEVVLLGNGGKIYREIFAGISGLIIGPALWDRPYAAQLALIADRERAPLLTPDALTQLFLREMDTKPREGITNGI